MLVLIGSLISWREISPMRVVMSRSVFSTGICDLASVVFESVALELQCSKRSMPSPPVVPSQKNSRAIGDCPVAA